MRFPTSKQNIERYNTLTHGVAALLTIPAIIGLLIFASQQGDPWRIVSFSIYGITLLLMYLFSTLYHGSTGLAKLRFQRLDHMAIYLLIAGTYTPFTLTVLKGVWGWSLFAIFWSLAIIGIIIDNRNPGGPRHIQMRIYFVMGWLMVLAAQPLYAGLSTGGMFWLLLGGILYTVGSYFYFRDEKFRYGHVIWHLFVIAGSASHYFTIFYYLL